MSSRRDDSADLDPGLARIDITVPREMRRSVLTSGSGGPLTMAHGEVAGAPAELVGDRARLELRRGGTTRLVLELRDWTAEAKGADPPPPATAQAWRFWIVVDDDELTAEVVRIRHSRSRLAEATRYWKITGSGQTWFFADGGAPDEKGRHRLFHLWRDQPQGTPWVTALFVDVRRRDVEDVVVAQAQVSTTHPSVTGVDEELLVLLAVGGFNGELVGRNARIRRVRRWLVSEAIDSIGDPVLDSELEPFELGP